MFTLFYGSWTNPLISAHKIIKFLLETSSDNSRTWSINLRQIALMYEIEDPFTKEKDPPSVSMFEDYIITKITFFLRKVTQRACNKNSLMKYFNGSMIGPSGKVHPALSGVTTSSEVQKY